MRTALRALPALSLLLLPAVAQAGNKHVPAQLLRAHYVAIGYDSGNAFVSERAAIGHPELVAPGDDEALTALRGMLEEWGQYVVTDRPEEAEILIGVRTARRAALDVGVTIGGQTRVPGASDPAFPGTSDTRGKSPSVAGEYSSDGNVLSVYDGGSSGQLLWRERMSGGSDDFLSHSFARFKADVSRALPKP